jgi:hypothetical protein
VAGLSGFDDGRTVSKVTLYCGTTDPGLPVDVSSQTFVDWTELSSTITVEFTEGENEFTVTGLDDATVYYFCAVAEDDSGNTCDPVATVPANFQTPDNTAPMDFDSVTFALGSVDDSSQITFGNLCVISDNLDETPVVTVIYNSQQNDSAESNGAIHVDAT